MIETGRIVIYALKCQNCESTRARVPATLVGANETVNDAALMTQLWTTETYPFKILYCLDCP